MRRWMRLRIVIRLLFFYACKLIVRRWIHVEYLSVGMRLKLVNTDIRLYQMTYKARGAPKKFRKLWFRWVDSDTLEGDVDILKVKGWEVKRWCSLGWCIEENIHTCAHAHTHALPGWEGGIFGFVVSDTNCLCLEYLSMRFTVNPIK